MVQQPIDMAWDTRGRLWVAECYTYAERETNFEKKLKDRIIIWRTPITMACLINAKSFGTAPAS